MDDTQCRIIRLPYDSPLLFPILFQNIIDPAKADVGGLALVHAAVAPADAVVEGQPERLRGQHGILVVDAFDNVVLDAPQRNNCKICMTRTKLSFATMQ